VLWGASYFNRLAMGDASGADVNCRGGEAMHFGEQVRFGVMCDVVGLGDAEGRIGGDVDFCSEYVADPADAEFADLSYALDGGDSRGGPVDDGGIHGVHEPCPYLLHG
jgi:hypothetical protein